MKCEVYTNIQGDIRFDATKCSPSERVDMQATNS